MDKRQIKILLIDDDVQFSEDLAFLLKDSFEVFTSHIGREGIKRLQNESFDLVLLDLKMPADLAEEDDEEGFEVLKQIRKVTMNDQSKMLPVIILTKEDTEMNRHRGKAMAANGFFAKPPDVSGLRKRICELI